MRPREFLFRYRAALIALIVSAAVHAAVFVSAPFHTDIPDEAADSPEYTATLEEVSTEPSAKPAPAPRPAAHRSRPRPRPRPKAAPVEVPGPLASLESDTLLPQMDVPTIDAPPAPPAPSPDVVAMAQPAVPVPALEPPKFPVEALPPHVAIEYKLSSAFADGTAKYSWNRDGDDYVISGEARAEGFFALFLEGQLRQESRGKVTTAGLRPDRFTEHKPGNPIVEGIDFDWAAKKATLDKGDGKPKTEAITGNTVDWLSMIFQLAHVPPKGDSYDLRVFTQRRFYEFHLIVMGDEEIDIPMGKVRAQHLRHVDPQDGSIIDVWLGIDQHYLPVKLRYPVARNRLVVEQSATSVTE